MEPLAHNTSPQAPGRPKFRDLLQKVIVDSEEKGEARGERIDAEPRPQGRFDVGNAIRQGKGQLLRGGATGLSHVIAADADRIPSGQVVFRIREDVGHQTHGWLGRIDIGAARDVFLEDIVLHRPLQTPGIDTLLFGHRHIQGQQDGCGGIDGHRRTHLVERDAVEQRLHIAQGVDRDPDLAHLPLGHRVIGVVADLGGKVKGDAQPGLPLAEEILVAAVRFLRRPEPCILTHGPEPASIHGGLHTTGKRIFTGKTEVSQIIQLRKVEGGIQPLHRNTARGGEYRPSLGHALQGRLQRVLLPGIFRSPHLFGFLLVCHGTLLNSPPPLIKPARFPPPCLPPSALL